MDSSRSPASLLVLHYCYARKQWMNMPCGCYPECGHRPDQPVTDQRDVITVSSNDRPNGIELNLDCSQDLQIAEALQKLEFEAFELRKRTGKEIGPAPLMIKDGFGREGQYIPTGEPRIGSPGSVESLRPKSPDVELFAEQSRDAIESWMDPAIEFAQENIPMNCNNSNVIKYYQVKHIQRFGFNDLIPLLREDFHLKAAHAKYLSAPGVQDNVRSKAWVRISGFGKLRRRTVYARNCSVGYRTPSSTYRGYGRMFWGWADCDCTRCQSTVIALDELGVKL